MLHNTGPYGPNEVPVNHPTPVNISQISGHLNMAHNMNNLSKTTQQSAQSPGGHYNLPDYAAYSHPSLNMGSQIGHIPNYSHVGLQHHYMHQNSAPGSEISWQNGMLPMNLNVQHDHSLNTINYHNNYDKRLLDSPHHDFKEQTFRKTPLNIPQVPVKSNKPDTYRYNDSYKYSNHNLDLSLKPQEKLQIDSTRRKNIENTVRLIENILINSSKNKEDQSNINTRQDKSDSTYETPVPYCSKPMTSPETTMSYPTKPISMETNKYSPRESPSNNINYFNSIKSASTSVIASTTTYDKKPQYNDQSVSASITSIPKPSNSDVCQANTEARASTPPAIATNLAGKPDEVLVNEDKSTSDEESSSESEKDVKSPETYTKNAEENELKTVEIESKIEIKVEAANFVDMDYFQPFLRDSHGVHRDDIVAEIVDAENSVDEATIAIKNDVTVKGHYECPHCTLLFANPKRFLIHTKWHTFGLTYEKRMELAKEREQKRNAKREAKVIARMNAKEVTDESGGKVFPCKDCDKVFSAKGSLKNHRQRVHPTRARECKICRKTVVGWSAMRSHVATHGSDDSPGYQCAECPKRFKYSHSLAKHKDTHLEKTHACAECPKMFGSQALLKMHMKTHERAQRGATYRCTYCGKGFYECYSLQVHERTHRNERPFLCEICNTSFGTNSSLKRHMKVSHSSSKPHECSVCHRSFSTERIRDRHELRVHSQPEDFKYPCKECSSRYLKLKDLQKHVYKAHPKNKRRKKAKSDSE